MQIAARLKFTAFLHVAIEGVLDTWSAYFSNLFNVQDVSEQDCHTQTNEK
jgi:hypothetical protein